MFCRSLLLLPALAVFVSLAHPRAIPAEPDPFDQSGIPIEVEPTDPKLTKIVLVAGTGSHKSGEHEFFAGCAVLMKLLKQTPGVFPVMVRDGWPKNEKVFDGAKAVVFFLDGGDEHSFLKGERMARFQKLGDDGVGLVHLHTVIDYPRDFGDRARACMGAAWEKGHSQRAHWVVDFKSFPDHPVCRGVEPFKIDDGWLTKLRFVPELKGVTPLLRTAPPKSAEGAEKSDDAIVCWTYERPKGGRSFAFTGSHLHSSWSIDGYRRMIVNGILWSAGVEVPKEGATVALEAGDLKKYLDKKTEKK